MASLKIARMGAECRAGLRSLTTFMRYSAMAAGLRGGAARNAAAMASRSGLG